MRTWLKTRLESSRVQAAIVVLILLNAVTLGLETSSSVMAVTGPLIQTADKFILAIFTLELLAKLYVYRRRFFDDAWNLFDLVVVSIALLPLSGPFTVLRVLRLLRLVSMVPRFRFVAESLLHALPGIMSIAGLLLVVVYVSAVMSTGFFGARFPQWFGTLGESLYSLFQIMTLESWSMGIVRPVMEEMPWAWAFFVPFILIATFTMLNLFIAVIVSAMQSMVDRKAPGDGSLDPTPVETDQDALLHELRALRVEVQALREEQRSSNGGGRIEAASERQ